MYQGHLPFHIRQTQQRSQPIINVVHNSLLIRRGKSDIHAMMYLKNIVMSQSICRRHGSLCWTISIHRLFHNPARMPIFGQELAE